MANFLQKEVAINKMPYEEWLLCQKQNTNDDQLSFAGVMNWCLKIITKKLLN